MNSKRRSSKSLQTIPKAMQPISIKEPSFGSVIKQGFGWGLGNSLAHSLFNTITSKSHVSEPILGQSEYKQCTIAANIKYTPLGC